MRCLFINYSDISQDRVRITDPGDIHHLAKALRASPGDILTVSDGCKTIYQVRISSISPTGIETVIESFAPVPDEPSPIILAQALIKPNRWEMLLEKVTELGVNRIIPVITERSRRLRQNKRERWEKIAGEAAKQCGRYTLVQLDHPIRLEELTGVIPVKSKKIILTEPECRSETKRLESITDDTDQSIVLLAGPEGGWSEKELEWAEKTGFWSLKINSKTLRSETAAIAAVGIMAFFKSSLNESNLRIIMNAVH